ncbi:hypothetical protein [Microcystis phage Mae-Yong924-2]|nr:hypothetical protein [Microcystis phage Mea-Yong924-1]QYC50707.1 hypothetical protein [Microcystis phage Mae-Yong924-2]
MRTQQHAFVGPSPKSKSTLWSELSAFVAQREHNYNSVHPKRLVHFEAIGRLKRAIDFYRFDGLESQCRILLRNEAELRCLIPGINSRYHANAQRRVDAMVQFCKQYLNQ